MHRKAKVKETTDKLGMKTKVN